MFYFKKKSLKNKRKGEKNFCIHILKKFILQKFNFILEILEILSLSLSLSLKEVKEFLS